MNKRKDAPVRGDNARPFDPAMWGFVFLPDHRPPGSMRFYEYQNHAAIDGKHDFRRLNLYLSQDGEFVTIWFGLLERIMVDALFHEQGVETPDYDEVLFRGYIESEEQAFHILKALRTDSVMPQVLRVDSTRGIVCEMLEQGGQQID